MSTNSAALDYALRYAREGMRVIWIPRGTKKPIAKDWPNVASCDPSIIQRWAAKTPGCNFGLVMGGGRIAIDIDDRTVLSSLPRLTETRLHETPGGGLHFIYAVAEDVAIKNTVGVFPHVDIRYKGAQIVGPGSVHPNGGVYKLAADVPVAPLPDVWLERLTKPQPAAAPAKANGNGFIPPGGQDVRLFKLAAAMQRQGATEDAMMAAMREEIKHFEQRPGEPWTEKDLRRIARSAGKYPPAADAPPLQSVQAMFNDKRAKVFMPSEGLEMADVAIELAKHLRGHLYVHNREIVEIDHDKLHVIAVQEFRTLVQKSVLCLRERTTTGIRPTTMTFDDSRGILASPQLREALHTVARVNTVRMTVRNNMQRIELLPEGYDEATQTFTASGMTYAEDMPFDTAVDVIRDLFHEFVFVDERSRAVAIAALMGMYAGQLISPRDQRPCFVVNKNAEGAGATLLVACCVVPILGYMPTGVMPKDDDEMRKKITAAVRAAATVIMLDNVKGRLDSAPLEALISAPGNLWQDRLLGGNESYQGVSYATVFCTSNGAKLSPDMRRRSLISELHLAEERAEDHKYKRELTVDVIIAMRPRILAACWALVRHWDAMGRPEPSHVHSSFPAWARVVGGIVEAAGFGCPLITPELKDSVDQDGDDMRSLVVAMITGKPYTFREIVDLCYREEIFPGLTGSPAAPMTPAQLSGFGLMFSRYDDRMIGDHRFFIDGKRSRARRYRAELLQ